MDTRWTVLFCVIDGLNGQKEETRQNGPKSAHFPPVIVRCKTLLLFNVFRVSHGQASRASYWELSHWATRHSPASWKGPDGGRLSWTSDGPLGSRDSSSVWEYLPLLGHSRQRQHLLASRAFPTADEDVDQTRQWFGTGWFCLPRLRAWVASKACVGLCPKPVVGMTRGQPGLGLQS